MDPQMGDASDPQTRLPYAYCAGDPVYNSDPTGMYYDEGIINEIKSNPDAYYAIYVKGYECLAGYYIDRYGLEAVAKGNYPRLVVKSSAASTPPPEAPTVQDTFSIDNVTYHVYAGAFLPEKSDADIEGTTGISVDEDGTVTLTYTTDDKTVTLDLTEPYVTEGNVDTQHRWWQYITDNLRNILGIPRTFPLGRDFNYRSTLLYDKESGTLKLVIETSTTPKGGPNSPYGNVQVAQHTDIVTSEGQRYLMGGMDPGTNITNPGDIITGANYRCYVINVTTDEFPFTIYSYNLYSWDQGVDFKGTAGLEEIKYNPLPNG